MAAERTDRLDRREERGDSGTAARPSARKSPAHPLLGLQQAAGNRAVARLVEARLNSRAPEKEPEVVAPEVPTSALAAEAPASSPAAAKPEPAPAAVEIPAASPTVEAAVAESPAPVPESVVQPTAPPAGSPPPRPEDLKVVPPAPEPATPPPPPPPAVPAPETLAPPPAAAARVAAGPAAAPPAPGAPAPVAAPPAPEVAAPAVAPAPGAEETGAPAEAAPAEAAAAAGATAGAGAAGVAPAVEPLLPPPPAELTPPAQARLARAQGGAGRAAAAARDLPKAEENVAGARQAVDEPKEETSGRAEAALVQALGKRPDPSPEIEELCRRIYAVIRSKRPPDEESLVEAKPEEIAKAAGGELDGTVQGGAQKVQGAYQPLATPPAGAPQQTGEPLTAPPEQAAVPPIGAAAAVPDPVPPENVSLDADVAASQTRMDEAGMTTEPAKLVQSGPVAEAREAQGEFVETAAVDPAVVLAQQQEALSKAGADMAGLQAAAVRALQGSRGSTVGATKGRQEQMVGSEKKTRESVSRQARGIFESARTRVQGLLEPLPRTAMSRWDAGVAVLSTQFKTHLKKVEDWIDERHSGIGGAILGAVDYLTGLPGWVVKEYDKAEQTFGDGVCTLVREISTQVNGVVAACEAILDDSRTRIDKLFDDLPDDLKEWAEGEKARFGADLDGLRKKAHATRDGFTKDLAERAGQAVQDVRVQIHGLRQKAGGLLGRIADAIGRFLDDPVKFIIEGLLDLLGIPPAAFWAVVARIQQVLSDIADDPLGFAGNLLSAVGRGFSQFFDHITDHLLGGLLEWLFAGLAKAGLTVPSDFSLKSVISFLLQLMGITWPRIRKLLAKHVGEKNVALLERAYEIVANLIDLGPEGIFELLKEQLNPKSILDKILDAAIDFLVEALIKQVSVRILLLFNPVGAILQALEAIYKVLKWVFENAARIFRLIETIVGGIADILAGNIAGMAAAVEKALAGLIAPVIDFLAGYLGLGDLPDKIRETIEKFQAWVEGILDRVIGFLVAKAKALLKALGVGGEKTAEGAESGFDGQVGKVVTWSAEGEDHRLWIVQEGDRSVLMMASDGGAEVLKQLAGYEEQAKQLTAKKDAERRQRALDAIASARAKAQAIPPKAQQAAALVKKGAQEQAAPKPGEVKAKDDEVEKAEDALWPDLQTIQIALRLIALPKTQVSPTSGAKASTVTAEPLTKHPGNTTGSGPDANIPGWVHVTQVDYDLLNVKTDQWGPKYWVKAHLLSEKLHGPGRPWNLVPARKTDNYAMEGGPESDAKTRIAQEDVLYYQTSVTFYSGEILEDFPNSITVQYGVMKYEEGKWVRGEALPTFSLTPAAPPIEKRFKKDLRYEGRAGWLQLGAPIRLALAIEQERLERGPFKSEADFKTRMTAVYASRIRSEDFLKKHWPTVAAILASGKAEFATEP